MQIKKTIKSLLIIFLSYITTIVLSMLADYHITQIDILLPIIFVLILIVFYYGHKNWRKDYVPYVGVCSLVFDLTIVIGHKIDIYEGTFASWSVLDIGYFLVFGIFLAFVFMNLFVFLEKESIKIKEDKKSEKGYFFNNKKYWLIVGLFLLAWLPYFLTFYPGNMGADTFESVQMCLGEIPWTNHHPVFFTSLINLFIKMFSFAGLTASLGIFTFFHMILFAATLSYILFWMNKKNISSVVQIVSLLFFALHPINAMYSMYITKDVLFSCVLVLLVLCLYDMVESKGTLLQKIGTCIRFFVLALLSVLLRNNGVYIVIIMAVVLLFVYKKYWKQLFVIFGSVLILTAIYKGPVFQTMGIEKQSFAESASVPLQQVGYVLVTDGKVSEEDLVFLEKLMPIDKVKEVFQPGYTDPYKFDESFDDDFINANVKEFMKVWWHLCQDNFGTYVKAYLMQTVGYWHYGETNSVCTEGVLENTVGVEQHDVIQSITGFSLGPVVEKLILAARKAPIFCLISSMAMQVFAVFMCVVLYVKKKKKEYILAWLPCIVLWITVMIASPAFCLFRYLFPLFLLWPVLLVEIIRSGGAANED